jgi:microcystin-dependent protein
MTLYKWSQTSALDATADSTINWAEGQAPSSVNDSARAMMAAVAKYRDDTSGSICNGGTGSVSGTASAYSVTSNQVFTSLSALRLSEIAFVCPATNAAGVTLNVDGLGAQPINGVDGTAVPGGTLIQGGLYRVTAYTGSFVLHDFYGNPYNIPIGGFLPYAGTSAPNSSFVLPFGQAISRSTYATLYSLVGNTYGAGDGSTTFNIPDLRGRAIFGGDSMGGSAANRLTTANSGINATNPSASGGSPNVTVAQNQLPNVAPTFTGTTGTVSVNSTSSVQGAAFTPTGNSTVYYTSGTTFLNATGSFTPVGTVSSINGGVTQQALITMPPAYILNFIMRVI